MFLVSRDRAAGCYGTIQFGGVAGLAAVPTCRVISPGDAQNFSRKAYTRLVYLGRVRAMARGVTFSAQTLAVLEALAGEPSSWRHGYDLARETDLKSGTLYPILVRLADRGVVEACWESDQPAGRPRRHLYRLTSEGFAVAEEALANAAARARQQAQTPGRAAGRTRRPLAGEGT